MKDHDLKHAKDYFLVPLSKIVSNSSNPRDAVPVLDGYGYGIFEVQEGSDKPVPLMKLALSESAEERAEFCRLIETYEAGDVTEDKDGNKKGSGQGLVAFAANILTIGQINPITVRQVENGFDLVAGCRRMLAIAYNAAKLGQVPIAQCHLEELSDTQSVYTALSENLHIKSMNPMEQAKAFDKLRKMNVKPEDIAKQTNVDHQTVRARLKLLSPHLKPEEQEMVASGEIPATKALALIAQRKDGKNAEAKDFKRKKNRGKRGPKAPSLSDWKQWYEEREDLHEKVREFVALEILQVEYKTFKAMKKELEKAEK